MWIRVRIIVWSCCFDRLRAPHAPASGQIGARRLERHHRQEAHEGAPWPARPRTNSRSQRGRKVSGVSIWTNPDARAVYVDGIAVDDDRSGHRRRRQHFIEKPANHAEL